MKLTTTDQEKLMLKEQIKHGTNKILIWDFPVRLFHWSLVLMFCISWITAEIGGNAMQYHMWSGYVVVGLVLFRILWGIAGSESARFSHFIHGPASVLSYTRSLFKPGYKTETGHTPLGGWSVISLLLVLATQAISGLFSNDDIANEGPLYHLVRKATSNFLSVVHQYFFNVLLGLVVLHLAAIVFYRMKHRDNLVKPMITGYKVVDANVTEPKQSNLLLAIVLALFSAGTVYWIVTKF